MKNKVFYFLLLFFSLLLPLVFLRGPLTSLAFLFSLLAIFGTGGLFLSVVSPSKAFDFNAFGIGFILLSGMAFFTAFLSLTAWLFIIISMVAVGYSIYKLFYFLKSGAEVTRIHIAGVIIFICILALNIYPTLQIQGFAHDHVFTWVNTDAAVYTSIANRVKLGIYPITVPGFGIEKLVYHFGSYAFAGFIAKLFNISASGALFGIIRPLAVLSVVFSLIAIAQTTKNKKAVGFRITGALAGFFLIGSLSSIFEYIPVNFPRVDHGMKHLRGFVIGHSSLWIFTVLIPFIALIHRRIVHKVKFNFIHLVLIVLLAGCTASLNFVAAAICIFLVGFFLLFFREENANQPFIVKRNIAIILLPFVALLAGISIYLLKHLSAIDASLIFLPVFDLGTWSNFMGIFFLLYMGLRLLGLNYLFAKEEIHLGYIQFLILMAAFSFMLLLGFFVEPMAGRENDIKYGYVIIEGTLGLFSGMWMGEKLQLLLAENKKSILVNIKRISYPLIIVFSILLLLGMAGFVNSLIASAYLNAYVKPLVISVLMIVILLLLTYKLQQLKVNKLLLISIAVVLTALSLPGALHEFNKYRTIEGNDETLQLDAADLALIDTLNKINVQHRMVLMAEEGQHTAGFATGYKYSALIEAPVLNEGKNYFSVKRNKDFLKMDALLDTVYAQKNIGLLKSLADSFGVAYFVLNTKLLQPGLFTGNSDFNLRAQSSDSIYILEYKHYK